MRGRVRPDCPVCGDVVGVLARREIAAAQADDGATCGVCGLTFGDARGALECEPAPRRTGSLGAQEAAE